LIEEALVAFQGNVIVVSHDRYFLNRVCTSILAFEGEGLLHYTVGNYDYYLEKHGERAVVAGGAEPQKAGVTAYNSARQAKPRKLKWKEARELEGMEGAILAAEEEVARIEGLLADPQFFVEQSAEFPRVEAELRAAREAVARLYARWEELGAIAKAVG
jgi:ATP-binding cassette subfamily F protein uup